jgi:queuine tRNA-ribosyltransferase
MSYPFKFEVLHTSKRSKARVGKIHTPHGIIDTPSFVAVGTNSTIKALDSLSVDQLGLQLLFCNTYHLMLQPGTDVVKGAGGLHRFMNRRQPIITDSGGFQVFSLAYGGVTSELKSSGQKRETSSVLKINEDGVLFRSYRDGEKILLTPEVSVQAQKDLGADIIIPFDELPPYHIGAKALRESFDRTHRWEKRSLDFHRNAPQGQAMYGVIHGGVDYDLREESFRTLERMEFDGYAIGGSVGKNRLELSDLLQAMSAYLPQRQPVHLLGPFRPKRRGMEHFLKTPAAIYALKTPVMRKTILP